MFLQNLLYFQKGAERRGRKSPKTAIISKTKEKSAVVQNQWSAKCLLDPVHNAVQTLVQLAGFFNTIHLDLRITLTLLGVRFGLMYDAMTHRPMADNHRPLSPLGV